MICRRCRKPIPFHATKCQNCYKKTGRKLSQHSEPVEDMYERPIYKVYPDLQKKGARAGYLKTLPDFIQLEKLEQKTKISLGKSFLHVIAILAMFFVNVFLTFTLTKTFTQNGGPGTALFIFVILMIVGFILLNLLLFSKHKLSKKEKIFQRNTKLHLPQEWYYANQDVFGYTSFDHREQYTDNNDTTHYLYFYGHYEIDKRNIKTIGYDSKYAEYILTMRTPVYMHYDNEPVYEFRIPDIFDDAILSNALSCDLPPKHIPF